MRKLFALFLIVFLSGSVVFAATDSATGEVRRGYLGVLPDITQRFDKQRSELAKPTFDKVESFRNKGELKPVPRDNPAYVNTMIKKKKISPYTNDVNDAIPLVESVIEAINFKLNIQMFNARVNTFNDWMTYFIERYKDKPEAYYISYQKLVEVDFQARYVANLKYEALKLNPYLAYSDEGAIYNPKNIETQTQLLLIELNKALELLKEVN